MDLKVSPFEMLFMLAMAVNSCAAMLLLWCMLIAELLIRTAKFHRACLFWAQLLLIGWAFNSVILMLLTFQSMFTYEYNYGAVYILSHAFIGYLLVSHVKELKKLSQ